MCNLCEHVVCGAEPLQLCQGHLVAFILETVADHLSVASREIYRELALDWEED